MSQNDFNHLLSSIADLSPAEMRQLRQQLDRHLAEPKKPTGRPSGKGANRKKPTAPTKKPLTRDEFNQQLMAVGLITSLPDPSLDIDDDDPADQPVTIKGEPLSETIIRERRGTVAAAYFVDSSGLVKRYVREDGTDRVRRLTRRSPSIVIYIARITAVEVTSAVARRRKGRTLTSAKASSILHRFRQHLAGRYTVVEITPALLDEAMRLASTHALCAYDAVQLAVALRINQREQDAGFSPVTLISADQALNNAATVEGLTVDDPRSHA